MAEINYIGSDEAADDLDNINRGKLIINDIAACAAAPEEDDFGNMFGR